MDLFDDLKGRGLVKDVTDLTLSQKLKKDKITLYVGFDPTADSLHIGSLLPALTLRRFQKAGHRPIAVVGGATGLIGDPSGKSQERQLLTPERIAHNIAGVKKVLSRFIDFDTGKSGGKLVNNGDWFENVTFTQFLRDVGKHFTVNHMLAKESVRARLEDRDHGISYTEFSYMLLQAYDFHFLHQRENCTLQVGGSDQWGNITAGCELIRRIAASENRPQPEVFGLTHPLIMKADGTKFGKTEGGNIWLDAEKTSPYQFYQFLLQVADADVMNLVQFLTFLSHDEIKNLEETVRTSPEKREAQKTLASELTKLVHGEAELRRAENASQALFGTEIMQLDAKTLRDVFQGAPTSQQPKASLSGGIPLIDLLVTTQLCSSKGAARKDLTAGGIYVDNVRVTDLAATVRTEHLIAGSGVVLRKGKKNYHLVSFND